MKHTITEYDEQFLVEQPSQLLLPLKMHQRASIYRCIEMEKNGVSLNAKESRTSTEYCFEGNFGIIGDKVGSGKSFIVLGLITSERHRMNGDKQFVHKDIYTLPNMYQCITTIRPRTPSYTASQYADLLIVPHTIRHQWKGYIERHTTGLRVRYIERKRDIETLEKNSALKKSWDDGWEQRSIHDETDLFVVSSTMVSGFYKAMRFEDGYYNRVIIDEADSITLSNKTLPNAGFYWYVTATYDALRYSTKGIRLFRNIYGSRHNLIANNIVKHALVMNDPEMVKISMALPDYTETVIECQMKFVNNALKDVLPSDIQSMINADNIRDVITELNCNSVKVENLTDLLTKPQQEQITKLERQLAEVRFRTYENEKRKTERIQSIENKIKELRTQTNYIQERIDNSKTCGICMCESENKSYTPCCNQLFCIGCITAWLNTTTICPFCRTSVHIQDMVVPVKNIEPKKDTIAKKQEALIQLLQDTERKPLVFSMYSNTFEQVKHTLNKHSISYQMISGTGAHVQRVLRDFEAGNVKVLLLNASHFGAGLNLQMASDVILYHKMSPSLEKQCIGRAQRPGRTTQLKVWKLYTKGEL